MEATHTAPEILSTVDAPFTLSTRYTIPVWSHITPRGHVEVFESTDRAGTTTLKGMALVVTGNFGVAGKTHDLTGDDAAEVLASLLEAVA